MIDKICKKLQNFKFINNFSFKFISSSKESKLLFNFNDFKNFNFFRLFPKIEIISPFSLIFLRDNFVKFSKVKILIKEFLLIEL